MKGGPEKPPGSETAFLKGFWWTRGDSNPRPPRCERGALPAELLAHEQQLNFSKRRRPCQHSFSPVKRSWGAPIESRRPKRYNWSRTVFTVGWPRHLSAAP